MFKPRDNRWYGYRRDLPDQRDHLFARKPAPLPATVDLREFAPPVMDQGELGSCTAHGITCALRLVRRKAGLADFDMARLQLYYDERTIEGSVKSDAGAEIRDGIKCIAKIGVAHEALWPYKIAKFASKPTAKVYKDAKADLVASYARVPVTAAGIKGALAAGYPVVIGISVFESFESDEVAKNGIVPIPASNEETVGGHCMCVVGYGQRTGTFTVRNSWAADWGNHGDCYIPEAYLGDAKFGGDYWMIEAVAA